MLRAYGGAAAPLTNMFDLRFITASLFAAHPSEADKESVESTYLAPNLNVNQPRPTVQKLPPERGTPTLVLQRHDAQQVQIHYTDVYCKTFRNAVTGPKKHVKSE